MLVSVYKEDYVGKIDNMIDNINKYLRNKGLQRLPPGIKDIQSLFEGSLRSVWALDDAQMREAMAVEIAQAVKPYYGGKKIEDALDEITAKLDAELKAKREQEKANSEKEAAKDLEKRLDNPDYVPTFDELMKAKKREK